MVIDIPRPVLKGKKALVVGIANDQSIAYGCAAAFPELGADLAITYLNEKGRPHVEPLARALDAILRRCTGYKAEYGEAESLYVRALGIQEKALGDHHPKVAQRASTISRRCTGYKADTGRRSHCSCARWASRRRR